MIMEKILTKEEINKILQEAMAGCRVIAPVMKDDIVFLKGIKTTDEVLFEYGNSLNSLKEFFFPSREVLFEYSDGIPKCNFEAKPTVIFGIRPCDADSLLILDKVFGGDYRDYYYFERREKTTLVGLSCDNPYESCFCTSLDGCSPDSVRCLDILLTRLENDFYFADIITEKGKRLLGSYGREPEGLHREKKQKKLEETRRKITKNVKLPENLDKFQWEKLSRKCIACGICRYLCPTCSCFSIADEEDERVRYWQPCSFTCFTKEAAGSNPKEKKMDRFKQWYFHKFDYSKKNIGMVACIGCGRCIRNCPVRTDFTEVLNAG